MGRKVKIYLLRDWTGEPRYVGATRQELKDRLAHHIREASHSSNKNTKRLPCIREALKHGPITIHLLCEVEPEIAYQTEYREMERYFGRLNDDRSWIPLAHFIWLRENMSTPYDSQHARYTVAKMLEDQGKVQKR